MKITSLKRCNADGWKEGSKEGSGRKVRRRNHRLPTKLK
jgi:hypothetical protein